MQKDVLEFILSFIGGLLWYRILFFTTPAYFKRPLTRSILKLRWHHWHWGVVLIFIGIIFLLLYGLNATAIVFLGIGLGFMVDLFIPSLQLETDRKEELAVYRNSLVPTLVLGTLIVIVIIILSFIN